jgi:hypothetical protein
MFPDIQEGDIQLLTSLPVNFQLGVDIGSSTVARGVVSLVLGYLNNLVIEMAFLVQVIDVHLYKTRVHCFCRLQFACVRRKVSSVFLGLPDAGQHTRRAPGVPPRYLPTELSRRHQGSVDG